MTLEHGAAALALYLLLLGASEIGTLVQRERDERERDARAAQLAALRAATVKPSTLDVLI